MISAFGFSKQFGGSMMILNNDKHISTRGGGLCGLSDTFQIIVVPEIGVAPSSKLSSVLSESAGYFVFRHLACKLTQLRRRFDLWHSNIVFSASSSVEKSEQEPNLISPQGFAP